MIRRVLAALALAVMVTLLPGPSHVAVAHGASSTSLAMFQTEAAAQAHVPATSSSGSTSQAGSTTRKGCAGTAARHGAYVCRKEADAAGDRDTRNGQ